MTDGFDVVVVGAGPAGMAAAAEATGHGLATLVIDEQATPGGQIYRSVDRTHPRLERILGTDYTHGRTLTAALHAGGAEFWPGTTVWYVSPQLEIAATTGDDKVRTIQTRFLIVATGAMERPFPVPGWTLPGVITAGAAQIMLKTGAGVPAGRVVLAGTGPLAYLLASQLIEAGCEELAFLDTQPRGSVAAALPLLPRALTAPSYLTKGARLLARVRRHTRPYVSNVENLAILGDQRAAEVRYLADGVQRTLPADWVLLHQGVVPNVQLTMAVGCRHTWDDAQLCWKPECDAWGRTTRENVFVAGDNAGIAGARAAEYFGRLAALQCAHDLDKFGDAERDARAGGFRSNLRPHLAIRPWLDRMYRAAEGFRMPADDTLACRCEEVTAGAVRQAVGLGCLGPNQLKFFTRCGMGPCQGRMCGLTVCEIIARERGVPVSEVGYYRIRQPLKPVTLALLAQTAQPIAKAVPYKT
jgi:NADPH-dependent 2,4-dienoyl-CoA reductase/sulfur reductase-like enzyme